MMAAGLSFALTRPEPAVTIVADGRAYNSSPRGRTVGDLLDEVGITLDDGDMVNPEPSTKAKPGTVIVVDRCIPVTVLVDGKRLETKCNGTYVRNALESVGAGVSERDLVTPALDEELTPGMTISVSRVTQETVTQRVSIPFQTQRIEDTELELGNSKVVQKGKAGLKETVMELVKLNGRTLRSTILKETIIEQPVPQVIALGTCGVVSRGGQTIRFKKALEVVATAYTPGPESTGASADGITATGLKAGFGIIAVDPKVIKLGSRVYVDGYGFAVAGDTGGAIKGARIDVCFESTDEAIRWGRKRVKVYVL